MSPYPDFQDWQRDAHSFEQMATLTWSSYDLTGRQGRHNTSMACKFLLASVPHWTFRWLWDAISLDRRISRKGAQKRSSSAIVCGS